MENCIISQPFNIHIVHKIIFYSSSSSVPQLKFGGYSANLGKGKAPFSFVLDSSEQTE